MDRQEERENEDVGCGHWKKDSGHKIQRSLLCKGMEISNFEISRLREVIG